jgi:hypothetical protein
VSEKDMAAPPSGEVGRQRWSADPIQPVYEPHAADLRALSADPFDATAWRVFFSLTGGSILYCLSALSIIYGIANILGPVLGRTDILREAVPCLAALNVYEIALLGVLVFIVVREKVTDDAMSLVVLVALFLAGSGVTLSTVANSGVRASLMIGSFCFCLGVAKLHVLRRYVGLALNRGVFGGLAVILAWYFLAGPLLAKYAAPGSAGRAHWLLSWWFLLAGGSTVFLTAKTGRETTGRDARVPIPFLRGPATPLLFAAILVMAGGVHQYVLGYVFDVRWAAGDYLPLVSAGSLIALQLSRSLRPRTAFFEAGLASVPLVACGFALMNKAVFGGAAFGVASLWHPPVLLAATGAAVFWVWSRARSPQLLGVGIAYVLGAILTLGYSPGHPHDLNWHASGALVVTGLLLMGVLRRSVGLCFLAVLSATAGIATTRGFGNLAEAWNLSLPGAAAGAFGLGTLAVALGFGRRTPRVLTALGALGVMAFIFDVLPAEPAAGDIGVAVGVLILCAALRLRLHDWPSIVLLLAPIAQRLWMLSSRFTAWKYVVLSFVLLFAGAWVSVRKGRRGGASRA